MTASFVAASGPVSGTNNATPTLPGGAAAGDLLVSMVGVKPNTIVPTVASGWTLRCTVEMPTGTDGADEGPIRVALFTREMVGGDTDPTFPVTGSSGFIAGMFAFTKSGGETWSLGAADNGGYDDDGGTSYSATGDSETFAVGDFIVSVDVINTDGPNVSSRGLTIGAGAGTLTNRLNAGTTAGNDLKINADTFEVTTGATAAPVKAITWSGGTPEGASAFLRVRAVASGTNAAAEKAAAVGTAHDATVSTAGATNAAAGHASATATVLFDPTGGGVSLELSAEGPLEITATAHDAAVDTVAGGTDAEPTTGSALATVHDITARIAASAPKATATGTAHNATITVLSSAVNPAAGHPTATVTAHDAAVSTSTASPTALRATATGTARNATVVTAGQEATYTFRTPTQNIVPNVLATSRGSERALYRHMRPHAQGIALLLIDGDWIESLAPTVLQLRTATTYYLGGYTYTLTAAEAAALTTAGYGDYIDGDGPSTGPVGDIVYDLLYEIV